MAYNGVVTADGLADPTYGLFSVAKVVEHGNGDEHWIGGYFVETESCGLRMDIQPLCIATDPSSIEVFDNLSSESPFFHVAPFGVSQTYECDNSVGWRSVDRRATVIRQLKNVTEYAIERELWLGLAAQVDGNPIPAERWLSNANDVTPVTGTAVKPELALGLVETNFAANNPGVQATIHMTPLMAAVLKSALKPDGDKLYTKSGSLVAISRGGDGDEGPASGGSNVKHWIYATGPVHVDLGSEELITVSMSDVVNPVTNEVTYTAERPAAVYFDGCAWYGALADATL